jgi:hypothetical protein
MKSLIKAVIGILISSSTLFSQEIKFKTSSKSIKPTLFADLGETCQTPDGMALDKKGNLYLSVTNPTTFEKFGSKILAFDRNDKPITWFDNLPLHPETKRVHPMGMEFGPDGNLYVIDNQCFARKADASRLIRVIVKMESQLIQKFWSEDLIFQMDFVGLKTEFILQMLPLEIVRKAVFIVFH